MSEYLTLIPFEVLMLSITTFFAVIGPVDVAIVFGAISGNLDTKQRKITALRSTLIATLILLIFCFFGQVILTNFGISINALRISGGILLLLISIQMIFAQHSNTTTTKDEFEEAKTKADISVFPLAVPLIAGPATMGTSILLIGQYQGNVSAQSAVVAGLLIVLLFGLICMLIASQLQKFLGVTGANVIQRIFGVLLSALAVQFIIDGLVQSKILN